jgi:hypothetical protein
VQQYQKIENRPTETSIEMLVIYHTIDIETDADGEETPRMLPTKLLAL